MMTLFLIGKISGIILVIFGFIHFLILDKIIKDPQRRKKMKWWVGKITLLLTIIVFGIGLTALILFLFQ